jgi:hypothetical protein
VRVQTAPRLRIVFIAIAGFTGEVTDDGRVLGPPEDGRLRHREYPLPVTATIDGITKKVGEIEMAAWCDRRIIIFGRMDPDPRYASLVKYLNNGTYVFEIDVDDVKIETEDDVVRMTSWRLAAAMIGQDPCWKLPKVQIEAFEEKTKEKEHV